MSVPASAIRERAFAKANLVLHVGPPRSDGLHSLCSLLVSLELADELSIRPTGEESDRVVCPGVEGDNLAAGALGALRDALGDGLPALEVRIEKRIPVAAGLGGGSADAAAVLRAANDLAGAPLGAEELREVAAAIGADVPAQVEPRHAVVTGAGENVEPVDLPELTLLLVPRREGLPTPEVFAELDRLGTHRSTLDPEPLRRLAGSSVRELAAGVENDLEAAALSLRPELAESLDELREAGALAAALTGSGPTAFGIFAAREDAERAARKIAGAVVSGTRESR